MINVGCYQSYVKGQSRTASAFFSHWWWRGRKWSVSHLLQTLRYHAALERVLLGYQSIGRIINQEHQVKPQVGQGVQKSILFNKNSIYKNALKQGLSSCLITCHLLTCLFSQNFTTAWLKWQMIKRTSTITCLDGTDTFKVYLKSHNSSIKNKDF